MGLTGSSFATTGRERTTVNVAINGRSTPANGEDKLGTTARAQRPNAVNKSVTNSAAELGSDGVINVRQRLLDVGGVVPDSEVKYHTATVARVEEAANPPRCGEDCALGGYLVQLFSTEASTHKPRPVHWPCRYWTMTCFSG